MIVLPRRVLLRGIAGLGLGARMAQAGPGHDPFGPVAPPQAAPSLGGAVRVDRSQGQGAGSAPAHWRAAAPRSEEIDRLFDFVRGRASGADRHSTQVYLFDRQARFVFRTASMPSASHVADVCAQIAAARG